MATATLKCRVCGKEYEACRSAKYVDGVFRWKDVACSPECGAVYLDLIRKSRGIVKETVAPVETTVAFFEDEYEDDNIYDEFDSEYEDDEEEAEIEV